MADEAIDESASDDDYNLEHMIKQHVQRVLIMYGGSRTVAAKKLGRSRFWLARKLREWGMTPEELGDFRQLRRRQREESLARSVARATPDPAPKSEADEIAAESPKYHDISPNDIGH
jgi:hypothetical protein